MMSSRWPALIILPLLSSIAGIGCTTPRMAPPADIAQASEVLPVSNRSRASGSFVNEGFKLGNYDVVDVDRKWNSTESGGIGPWSKETKTTGFSFALASNGKKLPGKCSSESRSQGLGGFSWGKLKIACLCQGEAGGAEVLMTDAGRTLRMGGKEYKLEPINTIEGGGTQSNPTGFRADGDEPLGAVEVVHPGQVWLKKGLDDATRAQTTCAFAGLMLYKAPSDDLTK
jgi:hypothetical protein